MENTLSIQIENDLLELDSVLLAFAAFYHVHHLDASVTNVIDLAAEEVITNIISYAYLDNASHQINIQLSLSDQAMTLEISDDGQPFNPLNTPAPDTSSSLQDRPVGKLGIWLIRKFIDDIHYEYKDNRNCLSLIKKTS